MKSIAALFSPRGSKGRKRARKMDDNAVARAASKSVDAQRKRDYARWLETQLPGFHPAMLGNPEQFRRVLQENGIALTKTKTKVDGVEKFYIVLTEHGKEVSAFKLEDVK